MIRLHRPIGCGLYAWALTAGPWDVSAVRAQRTTAAEDVGAQPYLENCASCHGEKLGGALGPPLKGDAFSAKWNAQGASALHDFILLSMPPSDPGGLSADVYKQITAFILQANKVTSHEAKAVSASPGHAAPTVGLSVTEVPAATGLAPTVENHDAQYLAAIKRRDDVLARLRPVDEAMLRHPPAEDWLNWRRTDDGLGYSPLDQINRGNARWLTVAWSMALPAGTNEITPLVHDGVMFLNSHGSVLAIDVVSGDTLWTFVRSAQPAVPQLGPPVTQPRSMAIFEDRLYVPTSNDHMTALDVHTGKVVWDHLVFGRRSTMRFTGGPIVVRGKVIQGMSGCAGVSEPGGCFIVGLDATTGREVWRFNTIPKPSEPGGDTWNGTPIEQRFGASVWLAGTYDPETNLVYFGTGQTYHIGALLLPNPKRRRENSGLYTDTTLALNPDTGKLVWHYQHMARDVWDLDWSFERMITTLQIGSKLRKVAMTMGKIGVLDVLDAKTGKYIFSYDLGLQNLVTGIDPVTGWKIIDAALDPDPKQPKLVCPFALGVRNWPATSYDPSTHLLYVAASDSCMDSGWNRGEAFDITYGVRPRPNGDGNYGRVVAINLATRKTEWTQKHRAAEASATLSTAGGLVFEGARDRSFRASDSASGEILWQTRLDNLPSATPITFAKDGVQYVAITTGGGNPNDVTVQSLTPEIKSPTHVTTLWVFKLAGTEEAPDSGVVTPSK
jgi:alcohol dehydrogenase (cytochrome c)